MCSIAAMYELAHCANGVKFSFSLETVPCKSNKGCQAIDGIITPIRKIMLDDAMSCAESFPPAQTFWDQNQMHVYPVYIHPELDKIHNTLSSFLRLHASVVEVWCCRISFPKMI